MATLRAAPPTRHPHTEQFSGILTDALLTEPIPQEGGRGKPKHELLCERKPIAITWQ